MESNNGILYVLTNKYMPGLYKIGITHSDTLNVRARVLYNTSVPVQFRCQHAFLVPNDKIDRVESIFHRLFDRFRVNPKREFFDFKDEAQSQLTLMQDTCFVFELQEITDQVQADLKQEADADIAGKESEALEKKLARRPNLNFHEMGLSNGSVLVFEDKHTRCVVSGPKKVDMDDRKGMSLSAITKDLLNVPVVRPTTHWFLADGRCLGDIYKECYG